MSTNLILGHVRDLLDANQPEKALELLQRSRDISSTVENARAVCLMRLGQSTDALNMLRPLVLERTGITVKTDASDTLKANFAAALLLDNNVPGCQAMLSEVADQDHPEVRKITAAVARWKRELGIVGRFLTAIGIVSRKPVILDLPPGSIDA